MEQQIGITVLNPDQCNIELAITDLNGFELVDFSESEYVAFFTFSGSPLIELRTMDYAYGKTFDPSVTKLVFLVEQDTQPKLLNSY